MLYKIAHIIRDRMGFLWEWLEECNSFAFKIRYRKGLRQLAQVLASHNGTLRDGVTPVTMRLLDERDASALAEMLARQPEEAFTYFRPHAFDVETLKKLIRRTSFIMAGVFVNDQIIGYFFLRSFVHGQSYLGKMVDHAHQGQGIGKRMCKAAMDVAVTLGIRMFESINRKNLASLGSSSVLKQVVVQELEEGDLLIEDLPL